MTLHSRFLDVLKSLDAAAGVPLARALRGRSRTPPTAPTDVLYVRLWGLGNLALMAPLLATPTLRRVRLMTLSRNADFVHRQFARVEVLALREPPRPGGLRALRSALAALRREPPEVVVDCEQFLRLPGLLARFASGAPVVGLDTPGQRRTALLDRAVAHDPTRHVADTFAALARAAGVTLPPTPPRLVASHDELSAVGDLLPPGPGPLVVLHPGSGDHFPGRRWAPERYGELATRLVARHGARVVLTGGGVERPLVRRVRANGPPGAVDLAGRLDAGGLIALLARADLVVSNDTGPVHLADALGTPVVALYGPNTPHRYGPRGARSIALFADLPCSPCLDDRTMKRSSCRHHRCMQALSIEAVLGACARLLSEPRGEPSQEDARALAV